MDNIELNVWYHVAPIQSELRIHKPVGRYKNDELFYETKFIDHRIGRTIRQGSQKATDFIYKLTQFELEFYNIKEYPVMDE